MTRPFSERVGADDWRAEATDWIESCVRSHGFTVTGSIEQPRIRPWSTQLTVPTDGGRLWFKTNCRSQAFEPELQQLLAGLVPHAFDRPFAVDAERHWMLTVDRGQVWGEEQEPSSDDWRRVVSVAARLQQELTTHGEAIRAVGVPDCSPSLSVGRFDRFLHLMTGLPTDHPAHVDAELAGRLTAVRPRLVDAVATLEESRLPVTWQHGDLHPWNVFRVDDELRLFDLGDSQWAHALEVLSVPFGWLMSQGTTPWEPIAEAYAAEWGLRWADLAADWRAVALTQSVHRTLTWWMSLEDATGAEWQEWGEGPVYHLSRMLEP